MDIGHRVEVGRQPPRRLPRTTPAVAGWPTSAASAARARIAVPPAPVKTRRASATDAVLDLHHRGGADDRERAVVPGDLVERDARAGGCGAARRISVRSSSDSSAVERKPWKNSAAGIDPLAPRLARGDELGVERERDRRQLGRRIGVRDAAADRAAVPDRRVRDQRKRLREQRCPLGDEASTARPAAGGRERRSRGRRSARRSRRGRGRG